MEVPDVSYARSGDVAIAYQVVGDELGRSAVDGRAWVVHSVDGNEVHLRKRGPADTSPDVKHHITAPQV